MIHPGQLHHTQRFDRDAVKAMLVDALTKAAISPSCTDVSQRGGYTVTIYHDHDVPGSVDFYADDLADRLIEWFGGKGAA